MNGAEALVRTLTDCGIDICFTNPGTSEMHFVAALDRLDTVYCVLALQENVATGAADGYARMTGTPAATLLHLGPGFGNGLANIHNAKKARTPMVNIVGDHATYHVKYDAPLTADVEGICRPVSHWVKTTRSADDVGTDAARAIAEAKTWPGRIATLILPADAAWNETDLVGDPILPSPPEKVSMDQIERVAKALRSGGKSMMFMSGAALTEPGLTLAGNVRAATGVDLISQTSNRRVDRGAGRVPVTKLPYVVDLAIDMLQDYENIVLLGAKEPVGFFAYPGKPSRLSPDSATIMTLAAPEQDTLLALEMLIEALDAKDLVPEVVASAPQPDASALSGEITPEHISTALAATMPENAIICDESITTGRAFFADTLAAPQHTWLQITGGAIGDGLPMALGAAMACPDQRVIVLQSDGSAMYTNQALWSMAREGCDITVLLFSNRAYRILEGEMRAVGVEKPGHVADALFSLTQPAIDWVGMAASMGVPGEKVTDAAELAPAMQKSFETEGPRLIEIEF